MGHRASPAGRTIASLLRSCSQTSRRRFLSKLTRSVWAGMALGYSGKAVARQQGAGWLELEVFDGDSSRLMPARIHVELPDGTHWTPLSSPTHYARPEILSGEQFAPMLAPARCSLDWTYLKSGKAVLELPAGKSRVFLSRGFEYDPVQFDIDIKRGRTERIEKKLVRWIDMPSQGIYSGDIHQHFTRRRPEDNELWMTLAEAEDLHFVNTMVLKHGEPFNRYTQYAYGAEGTHQEGHYVIAPGEEFRDNDLSGHMTLGGIDSVIQPISTGPTLGLRENFPPFAVACREARRQGAVVGWAHGGLAGVTARNLDDMTPRGIESVSVEAALGLIDFLEVVQFTRFLGEPFWYRLLGAGVEVAGVGGSDFPFGIWLAPWYPTFGQERTFVKVEGSLSSQSWFEGVKRGKVFSSNGPMIWLTVEGRGAGDSLDLKSRGKVHIRTSAESAHPLDLLEIVVNGRPAASFQAQRDNPRRIEGELVLELSQSSWVSARTRGLVQAETFGGIKDWPLVAHAGIVVVKVEDKPVRVRDDLEFLMEYTHRFRKVVQEQGVFDTDENRQVFLENIDEAMAVYRERLSGL